MAQTTMSVRIDKDLKDQFDQFCDAVGMNASVAVNLFVRATLREQKIPFEIAALDPFYSAENMERLRKSIAQMETTSGTIHEVSDDDQSVD